MNRGAARSQMKGVLIVMTCFIYLIGAGLFSKGVWSLEADSWNQKIRKDLDKLGSGMGSYDISQNVWHVKVSLSTLLTRPKVQSTR